MKKLKQKKYGKQLYKAFAALKKSMEMRKVAIFVLRDESGKILLQHKDAGAPRLANYWAFFGGGIEKGETPEQAVKREAKEELQIELKPTFFKKYTYERDELVKNRVELTMFTAPLEWSVEQLKKQQLEGDYLGLFTLEETKKLKIWERDRKVIEDLFTA